MKKLILLSFVMATCACSNEDTKRNAAATPGATSVLTDSTASSSVASEQLDEAVTAAVDDVGNMSFALTAATDRTFVCTVDAAAKTVTVSMTEPTVDETVSKVVGKYSATGTVKRSGSRENKWTYAGTETTFPLACNTNNRIKFNKANQKILQDTTLVITPRNSFASSLTVTVTTRKTTETFTNELNRALSAGTRTVKWTSSDLTDTTNAKFTKSIAINDITRTLKAVKKSVTIADLNIVTATKTDAPIVVEEIRNKTTQTWVSKKIISGTMLATKSGDTTAGKIETQFVNVLYEKSNDNVCIPSSGQLNITTYDKDGIKIATTSLTFDKTDTIEPIKIIKEDGTTEAYVDYNPEKCDLEKET